MIPKTGSAPTKSQHGVVELRCAHQSLLLSTALTGGTLFAAATASASAPLLRSSALAKDLACFVRLVF